MTRQLIRIQHYSRRNCTCEPDCKRKSREKSCLLFNIKCIDGTAALNQRQCTSLGASQAPKGPCRCKTGGLRILHIRAVADPVAQHDVVVHDWLDDGVPDGAPPQQRLRQAGCQHVPHPPAHVSLHNQRSPFTGRQSPAMTKNDLSHPSVPSFLPRALGRQCSNGM